MVLVGGCCERTGTHISIVLYGLLHGCCFSPNKDNRVTIHTSTNILLLIPSQQKQKKQSASCHVPCVVWFSEGGYGTTTEAMVVLFLHTYPLRRESGLKYGRRYYTCTYMGWNGDVYVYNLNFAIPSTVRRIFLSCSCCTRSGDGILR